MLEFPIRNGRWEGGGRGLCSRPSPGLGFYLQKECRAGEILDFIYANEFRAAGGPMWICRNVVYMRCLLNDNVLMEISAIVNTILRIARANCVAEGRNRQVH